MVLDISVCVCSVCHFGAHGAEQVMVLLTPRQLGSKKRVQDPRLLIGMQPMTSPSIH